MEFHFKCQYLIAVSPKKSWRIPYNSVHQILGHYIWLAMCHNKWTLNPNANMNITVRADRWPLILTDMPINLPTFYCFRYNIVNDQHSSYILEVNKNWSKVYLLPRWQIDFIFFLIPGEREILVILRRFNLENFDKSSVKFKLTNRTKLIYDNRTSNRNVGLLVLLMHTYSAYKYKPIAPLPVGNLVQ